MLRGLNGLGHFLDYIDLLQKRVLKIYGQIWLIICDHLTSLSQLTRNTFTLIFLFSFKLKQIVQNTLYNFRLTFLTDPEKTVWLRTSIDQLKVVLVKIDCALKKTLNKMSSIRLCRRSPYAARDTHQLNNYRRREKGKTIRHQFRSLYSGTCN